MSRKLTKQACAELRTELRDLGYGQAEGQTPELVGRRLYPVPEHLRALDPNLVLVVGPRGSGKSELFNTFFKHGELRDTILRYAAKPVRLMIQSSSVVWKPAYPAGTEFPDSLALDRRIDSDARAKTLWHVMLTRRLNSEFPASVRKQFRSLTAPTAAAIGSILRAMGELTVNPTAALDLLEKRLQREDGWIFVGYDELDTLGGSNWDLMARLVRGLIAFWSEYGRRWQRIRAKIFLRSDLFRRHSGIGTADFAKLAANRSELVWSDANLLGMLVKRIANTSASLADYCRGARIAFAQDPALGLLPKIERPEHAYPLLERIAGEYMGAGRKKGYVRNWVLDHLRDGNAQVSPRTLVRLFELAATNDASNQTLRAPKLLHPTALRQALDDVSQYHVTQASSEWPWLEGVRVCLRGQPLVPWSREEIVSLLKRGWDGAWGSGENSAIRPPKERPDRLVDYLVELGIFRRRSDDRIDVPDLYLSGLGLRRKGGVSSSVPQTKPGLPRPSVSSENS